MVRKMENHLITQLKFVRTNTIRSVEGLDEKLADIIPKGFNNNIRWNLGHIYLMQERLAFQFAGEAVQIPNDFISLFNTATKPSEWSTLTPPSINNLVELLTDQTKRIESKLANRLEETLREPYTTSTGLTLTSIGGFLSFSLYHEGMHFDAIKVIKRIGQL
jgi:hypothetical protein